MFIKQYDYITANVDAVDHLEIEGINREDFTTSQFMKKFPTITLTKPTAVLYAGGFGIHQSESRDLTSTNPRYVGTVSYNKSSRVIKESTAYSMHQWIGNMKNNELVVYANINSNTCASSMHSIYEAQKLLDEGVCEEVIVIAEERTSFNTIRIFKEHGIDVMPSDGIAIVRFSKDKSSLEVTDTKWAYSYNRNPFHTSIDGYALVDSECGTVKPHGTNTVSNNAAEASIISGREVVYYKKDVGHSQGVSALLELCMAIDDDSIKDDVLCVASGLGNFYGSCILHKTK